MEKGYTLVELLTSITITVILLSLGFSSFRSFGATSELNSAGDEIRSVILEARNLALSPESNLAPDIFYYGVRFNVSDNSFDLVRVGRQSDENTACDPNSIQPSKVIESFNLPRLVNLESAHDLVCISIAPDADVSLMGGEPITIRHLRTERKKQVIVNEVTGQVSIESGDSDQQQGQDQELGI